MNRLRHLCLTGALALLGGCAGDPTLDGDGADREALTGLAVIPQAVWSGAPAGCEGVSLRSVSLAAVEDAPTLAALVDGGGAVVCVDALTVLLDELDAELIHSAVSSPAEDDPSPQPSDPGPSDPGLAVPRLPSQPPAPGGSSRESSSEASDPASDPTPTPMFAGLDEDPTPTPMFGGAGEDPTPTPMLTAREDPREEDPTPTPMLDDPR